VIDRRATLAILAAALLGASTMIAATARAQEEPSLLERFSPDVQVAFVTNLEERGLEAFSPGVSGAVHVDFNVWGPLGLHGGGQLFVLTPGQMTETYYIGSQLGARFHLTSLLGLPGDGFLGAHWIYGVSEGITANGFDAELGYLFEVTPVLGLGAFVRYTWMDDPGLSHPQFLFAGIEVSLLSKARVGEQIPDEDLDGVADHEDICPQIPIGQHADPDNAGCPARDRDDDGLVDPMDRCPSEPMWPHADRENPGCPMPDADGDGVPDAHDVCPSTFAPDGGDALREGCPEDEAPF
jgi:hypothetical protein